MNSYAAELNRAMRWLAEQRDTVFMGQAVGYPGTAIYGTLEGVPEDRRIELPVAEDMQMGQAIGLALASFVPICIYPRWQFMLLAMNQLVLHLDKLPHYSQGGYFPKVIIRVAVPSTTPLDPQAQHQGDYSAPVSMLLDNVELVKITHAEGIVPAYQQAYHQAEGRSTIIVERVDRYA